MAMFSFSQSVLNWVMLIVMLALLGTVIYLLYSDLTKPSYIEFADGVRIGGDETHFSVSEGDKQLLQINHSTGEVEMGKIRIRENTIEMDHQIVLTSVPHELRLMNMDSVDPYTKGDLEMSDGTEYPHYGRKGNERMRFLLGGFSTGECTDIIFEGLTESNPSKIYLKGSQDDDNPIDITGRMWLTCGHKTKYQKPSNMLKRVAIQ